MSCTNISTVEKSSPCSISAIPLVSEQVQVPRTPACSHGHDGSTCALAVGKGDPDIAMGHTLGGG